MDKRVDEKILDFINEVEKRKARKDIRNRPIKIGKRYYEFEESRFYHEKLKMHIPKDFEDMPEEARKFKYPPENSSEIIKCNDDGSIVITLNKIDRPLEEKGLEELKEAMKVIVKKSNPSNVFYKDGVLNIDSKDIAYLEFKSYAIDDALYNLTFFLEFETKTLIGTFSCNYTECEEWRDIAFKMINTIKVVKQEEE